MFTKHATTIIALAGCLASAIPAGPKAPRLLAHDDVVLPRADGGFDVMKDWEWETIERRLEREARTAQAKRSDALTNVPREDVPNFLAGELLGARDCEESKELQVLEDSEFTDWDVAMSPVLGATGGTATVMVTKGYSVANAVTVSVEEDITFVPEALSVSMGIQTTETWTTTDTQTFSFIVNPGQYGVVVSNPLTRRVAGNVLSGCTDAPEVATFSSDSRSSQTFAGDLTWVAGPIRLCNSTTYPVPFCVGDGEHN